MDSENGNGGVPDLPPPPPVPEDVVPIKAPEDVVPVKVEPEKKKFMGVPMARRGLATKGKKAQLLTNHFEVNVSNVDGHFFHYSGLLKDCVRGRKSDCEINKVSKMSKTYMLLACGIINKDETIVSVKAEHLAGVREKSESC